MMTFIHDGEAKIGKHIRWVLLHRQGLKHADNDVFIFDVQYLALDLTHTCAGQELLDSLNPLIQEKSFMDDH